MQCQPPENAVRFGRMIAEHCAQLVEECPADTAVTDEARLIRPRFALEMSPAA